MVKMEAYNWGEHKKEMQKKQEGCASNQVYNRIQSQVLFPLKLCMFLLRSSLYYTLDLQIPQLSKL